MTTITKSDQPGEGAVTYEQCPYGGGTRCKCGRCSACGYPMHTAIHGPTYGQPAGSKPYGHLFLKPPKSADAAGS